MRYALLLHHPEPADGELDPELVRQVMEAFAEYGRALHAAGVLHAGEVLAPGAATTTVSLRTGSLEIQDGPFAETKDALAGVFVVDVPDLDAALGWAEKCPAAQFGTVEVRPVATWLVDGAWTGRAPAA